MCHKYARNLCPDWKRKYCKYGWHTNEAFDMGERDAKRKWSPSAERSRSPQRKSKNRCDDLETASTDEKNKAGPDLVIHLARMNLPQAHDVNQPPRAQDVKYAFATAIDKGLDTDARLLESFRLIMGAIQDESEAGDG